MDIKKAIRTAAALTVIFLAGYFYSVEFRKNWASLRDFNPAVDAGYLVAALSLYLLSYLLETFTWQVCINRHLGRRELDFPRSVAVVNASGLLKYLPGRVWTYTAQMLWLKKYNISKPMILYINMICILGSVTVSLYLGLIYLALYTDLMTMKTAALAFASLILFNILYVAWNSSLLNKLILLAGRLFNKDIQPLSGSKSLILFIQFIYACSWIIMGFAGYFLARGIGLNIPYKGIYAILASMSISWLVGYFAIISPGGLGIREGMMLVMLRGAVDTQTALIFPILSRLVYLIAEALLGVLALALGIKYDIFTSKETAVSRTDSK